MSERPRYYRRIIHISALDSPNVRYGLAQERAGLKATGLDENGKPLVRGILTYAEYKEREATWDAIRKQIGLYGRFYEGAETLLFPPTWLDRAERLALFLRNRTRIARGMGVDPGEGSSNTAISVVDEYGLIELRSERTPDTNRVVDFILEMMYNYNLAPERVFIDRGGGGKQHADRLRANGVNVRTIGFGDKPSIEPQRHKAQFNQKVEANERKYAYFNRRAEMYGELRYLLDPGNNAQDIQYHEQAYQELATERGRIVGDIRGFALPNQYTKLREQLAPIPMIFDNERLKLPPKHRRDQHSRERTLTEIIGYSPDEADSLVLAIHAMQQSNQRAVAGVV